MQLFYLTISFKEPDEYEYEEYEEAPEVPPPKGIFSNQLCIPFSVWDLS